MSQQKTVFGCCDRQPTSLNVLSCQYCKNKFHLSCVNINKSLKELSEEFKTKFTCPCCVSKLPKTDNTNTPLRAPTNQQAKEGGADEPASGTVNFKRGSQPARKCTSASGLTADNIRQIIKEELESVLEDFKASMINEFELKTKEVLTRFNQVSNSLKSIQKQQESIKDEVKSSSDKISLLESENSCLKQTVSDLTSRISQMEQHSRASNLEIQNVPEFKSENLNTLVEQIASTIDCKLEKTDIAVCTRIAKANKDSQRPRSIVIKFSSQRLRDSFLASALKFNKKAKNTADKLNSGHLGIGGDRKPVFVVEHLSPTQKALHAEARSKARELCYKFVWVRGGRIYMRKTDTSEYRVIKNSQDLSKLT